MRLQPHCARYLGKLKGDQAKLLLDFRDSQQALAAALKPERVQGQANKVNAQLVAPNTPMDVRSALKSSANAAPSKTKSQTKPSGTRPIQPG